MHCFIFLAISKIGLTVGLHIVSIELVRLFLFPVLPYCVHDSLEFGDTTLAADDRNYLRCSGINTATIEYRALLEVTEDVTQA